MSTAQLLVIIGLMITAVVYVLLFLHERLSALQALTRPLRAVFYGWQRALRELEQKERKR